MAAGTKALGSASHKGARRRLRLFLIVVCGFTGWAGLTLWEQAGSISQKQYELLDLQGKLSEVQAANDNYTTEITRLHDSEYIEQKVRKDFGMVRPGDTIFDR